MVVTRKLLGIKRLLCVDFFTGIVCSFSRNVESEKKIISLRVING